MCHLLLPIFDHNTTSPVHVQSVHYLYFTSQVIKPFLLSTSSQNTRSSAYFQLVHHPFCPYAISTAHFQSEYHLSYIMSCQYIICTTHVLSEHYLPCPCPVNTLSALPMSCHNTISPVHVLSTHYLCYPSSVRIPPLWLMSSQHTTSLAHVQLVSHI